MLQLISPFRRGFVKFDGLEQFVAFIEKDQQRLGINGKGKRLVCLGHGDGKALYSRGGGDGYLHRRLKKPDMATHVLRLLYLHAKLPCVCVVGRGHRKTRRAAAIDPLVEEAVDVHMCRYFDGFDQVRSDHVLQTIYFQIVLQGVKKASSPSCSRSICSTRPAFP